MVALQVVLAIAVFAFFLWLIAPSGKGREQSSEQKRAGQARRIGFLVGYIMEKRRQQ